MWPAQVLAPYADRPSRPQPDESAPACHLAHGRDRRRAFARTAADLLSRHAADAVERRSVGGIGQARPAASRSRACIAEQAAAGPRRYGFAIMWLRRRLAARAGVRSIRCDDLGHTCATLPRWATKTSWTRPMTTDPVAVTAAVSRRFGDRYRLNQRLYALVVDGGPWASEPEPVRVRDWRGATGPSCGLSTVGQGVTSAVDWVHPLRVGLRGTSASADERTARSDSLALEVSTSTVCRSVLTPPGPGGHPSVGGS